MNEDKHTKFVEVPQKREWQGIVAGEWAYVWEDGYDALAHIHYIYGNGMYHWWTTDLRSGFEKSLVEAKRATGYA